MWTLPWIRSGIEADVLHDVDLAARRPARLADVRAQRPDGRPRAAARRHLRPYLHASVQELEAAARDEASRGVRVALVRLLSGLDHEVAALGSRVLGPRGVVLLLVVGDVADVVVPLRGVEGAWSVELVCEDQSPAGRGGGGGGADGRLRQGTAPTGLGGRQDEKEGEAGSERQSGNQGCTSRPGRRPARPPGGFYFRSFRRSRISVSNCTSAGGGAGAAASLAANRAKGRRMKK